MRMTGDYEAGPVIDWPTLGAIHPELVQASLLPLPAAPARPMSGVDLSAYELWPAYWPSGYIGRPRLVRRVPFYGVGAEAIVPPTPAPAPEVAKFAPPIGKGIFLGTAYGIALGMVTSELIVRKADAAAQLKQNHQLIMLSALIGAAVGGFGAVNA